MANNATSGNGEITVAVSGLWKVFGPNADEIINSERRTATKQYLLEQTNCVMAVRDASFEVRRGEIFVIMGLSGSGKSTLIRCLLRLIEPTLGKIIINGEDICGYDDEQLMELRRHTTGMVFQYFGLFPHRNVLDNVAYGLKVRGMSKEERYVRAREVIDMVGLNGWEDYYPATLSGGMQQRVGIARALAIDPDILLMDEPFSGLDPLIRRQMQDQLIELQAQVQKTILFVTHDLDEALKLGSHIAIMKDGDIIQIGTPEEVIVSPGDAYVQKFVQDASAAKVVTANFIMEQPNILLYEWEGPKAAMHMLMTAKITHAFLVARGNRYLGLVTLERLVELFRSKGRSLKEALQTNVPTCTPDTVIEDLLPLAVSTEFPIPVVDDNGKLLGEIHNSTIILSLIQEKGAEEEEVVMNGETAIEDRGSGLDV